MRAHSDQTPRRRIKRLFQIKEKVRQELKLLFSFLLKFVPKTVETLLSSLLMSISMDKVIILKYTVDRTWYMGSKLKCKDIL